MLNFALEYRAAIDKITDMRKLGLGDYELTKDGWALILKDATLYFSHSTPNLAMVIPAINHIDQVFTNEPAIRTALGLAKCTLNRYYSMMDRSEVYHIAMVLHPRHKLSYFRSVGWEQQWIKTAEKLV
ncbi:hypothetical protein DFJ58DRAFT_718543 [Suillus subalutaceus]|uniref:uncharacterized protein n=1 Tax=Suillus subalutaceus TaxID=48586 RepID=UPI001B8870B6|nr:uncharacterized protein DFJ58DRAFT_718543 [Suillus subalutaceus]KAG1839440.1 hypothetical protein DFJ58DRAFT_718543 [Suillus subalutaceus]